MIKSIQTKILIMFCVIGLIIIIGMGAFFIAITNNSIQEVETIQELNTSAIVQTMNSQKTQTEILILFAILVFSLIMLLVIWFVSKAIIKPMNRIVENAIKIANGENVELVKVKNRKRKRRKNEEVDEFTHAFGLMTSQLKDKLTEVDEQKREMEAVLQHMADGIIAFDSKGLVRLKNLAAIELLELTDDENTFEKIFSKRDIKINMDAILYLENFDTDRERMTVGDRTLDLSFAPYKDENDLQSGLIVLIQDITEHVKLDEMRKDFIANVNHELKTPLTSIMSYAETLADGDFDKETETKFLDIIIKQGNNMKELVGNLLKLSQYDKNLTEDKVTEFDLGEVAKECKEKLDIEAKKKNQTVNCFNTADVPLVTAYKKEISRVITNVLSNAIKYTPENGEISIYVGYVYNYAYVKVKDNGIGIPKEDREKVFERFYRVEKARSRDAGGTGLGLAIAKEIMEKHKGSIEINPNVKQGTEVLIRLPVNNKQADKKEESK